MTVSEFNARIIDGPTGFKAMLKRQQGTYANRDLAVAEFVIRCLANPRCEGSQDVLDAIAKQRTPAESVVTIHI